MLYISLTFLNILAKFRLFLVFLDQNLIPWLFQDSVGNPVGTKLLQDKLIPIKSVGKFSSSNSRNLILFFNIYFELDSN